MKFRVSCRIHYEVRSSSTLLFNIRPRHSRGQKVLAEQLTFSPELKSELVISEPEGNRFDRVQVGNATEISLHYEAEVETKHRFLNADDLRKVPAAQLAPAQLPYLFPSRYCQSDRLARLAWQKFGSVTGAYDQVLKISEWIHDNVEYQPGATTSATSAYDTPTECAGVCRDFAHLGIALCRALTIPARYFTGYAYQLDPPDFHACFEAYIGDCWVLFDATRLASPNGLVRIGSGRDAADVSVCTVFGLARTLEQEVKCEVAGDGFQPLTEDELRQTAISLDACE